ncbi:MAG: hypothetical protein QOJ89_1034, partial [bacterium]
MAHSYSQKILWTALPRGHYEDGSLRLVVFVSPQLTTDDPRATLADFPDLLHWPTVLAGIDFEVRLGDVTLDPQSITVASAPAVRPEYWEALFGPTMVVRSFTPPPGSLGLAAVASYPAGDIVDFAKQLYSGYLGGDGATDLPAVHDLLERLAPVSFADVPASTPGGPPRPSGADRRRRLLEALSAEYSQGRYVGSGPPPDAGEVSGLAFVQHQEFHKSFTPNVTDPRRLKDPERDFHDYVSALGHYRDLVRLLGLAVDLKIAAPGATAAPFPVGPTTVRVTPKRPPVPMGQSGPPVTATAVVRRDLRPTTRAMLSAGQFLARPRAVKPLLVGGRLPFSDTGRYRAIEIDHDGAAFKLNQMGENLQRARDLRQAGTHAAAGPPSPQGLPVLRARGISVALTGRRGDGDKPPAAGELVTQIDRGLVLSEAVASNDETALLFDAEDVTRGYRVDVWDDHTKRWNSLSAREGTFAVAGAGGVATDPVPFVDQAIHQLAPTSAPGDAPSTASKALHLQQTLFHWTGWSLGAHRPGKALVPRYRGPGPAPAADPALSAFDFSDPRPPSDFPLQIASHAKPGSLPRLRFGFSYYVRARAADLAGDSVEFGDPHMKPGEQPFKDCLPTPELFYARFDPVSSPPLVFREPATEGASIARLVLRSNYDEPPQAPPADPATAIDERHVVPPKSSMLMIEQHGRLDSTATPPVDPGVYSLLAQRDGAR